MINMFMKNVGRPPVLIIQFIPEYIIKLTLLHLCLCYSDLKEIIFGLNMMQMNRQWMNTDRRSREYIAGMHAFLEMTKTNKNPKGFIFCPCSLCRNDKDYSDWGTLHLHFIKNGFMANYVLWTSHGERRVYLSILSPARPDPLARPAQEPYWTGVDRNLEARQIFLAQTRPEMLFLVALHNKIHERPAQARARPEN
jgi:hypothetical protein